jgi:BRO1-like domain
MMPFQVADVQKQAAEPETMPQWHDQPCTVQMPAHTDQNAEEAILSHGPLHADQRVERTTVAFEKAAVLFNLGAALSADAAAADLSSNAGCKRAARRFQVSQTATNI